MISYVIASILLAKRCRKVCNDKLKRADILMTELRKRLDAFSKVSSEELAMADTAVPKDEPDVFTPTQPQQYSRSIDYRQYVGDSSFGMRPSINISAIVCARCGYPKGHHHNGKCPKGVVYNRTNKTVLNPTKRFRSKTT
jgi:hypothetical protein